MTKTITIKIDGDKEIISNVDKVLKFIDNAVDKSLKDSGEKIKATIQDLVPVRSGNLKNSIVIDEDKKNKSVSVGPDLHKAPYAWYIEFGRSRTGATPPYPFVNYRPYMYMTETEKKMKTVVKDIFEEELSKLSKNDVT